MTASKQVLALASAIEEKERDLQALTVRVSNAFRVGDYITGTMLSTKAQEVREHIGVMVRMRAFLAGLKERV